MPAVTASFAITGSIRIPSPMSGLRPDRTFRIDNAVVPLVGYAPTLSRFNAAGTRAMTLQGLAPSAYVSITGTWAPGAGAAPITGYAPSIAAPASVLSQPGAGSVSTATYGVAIKHNYVMQPDNGQINYVPWPPTETH